MHVEVLNDTGELVPKSASAIEVNEKVHLTLTKHPCLLPVLVNLASWTSARHDGQALAYVYFEKEPGITVTTEKHPL